MKKLLITLLALFSLNTLAFLNRKSKIECVGQDFTMTSQASSRENILAVWDDLTINGEIYKAQKLALIGGEFIMEDLENAQGEIVDFDYKEPRDGNKETKNRFQTTISFKGQAIDITCKRKSWLTLLD